MRLPNIESIGRSYDHVYLSAHMDDAVMSCGGRIAAQIENGESVLVVTVFTGGMKTKNNPVAGTYSTLTDTKNRRLEDERAMGQLCADYLWLDYLDSIFRYKVLLRRYSLYRQTRKTERALEGALFTDIERICKAAGNTRLYCPLGIGQHVDHHILFSVGMRFLNCESRHFKIRFYEDIPYALYPNMLKYRMRLIGADMKNASLGKGLTREKPVLREVYEVYRAVINVPTLGLKNSLLKPAIFVFLLFSVLFLKYVQRSGVTGFHGWKLVPEIIDVTRFMNKKMGAILAYHSQLQDIIRNREAITNALASYSQVMGGCEGQYLERCWDVGSNPAGVK